MILRKKGAGAADAAAPHSSLVDHPAVQAAIDRGLKAMRQGLGFFPVSMVLEEMVNQLRLQREQEEEARARKRQPRRVWVNDRAGGRSGD